MSNVQPGANAGGQQESIDGALGGAPAGNEPAPLHESWTKALDEGGIPDLLRSETSPLVQQIRRSEAEANRRIEELSQRQAPQEWTGLLAEAAQQGVTPDQLIEAYNTGLQIRENPFGFIDGYIQQVNQMVQQGQLTAPQGWTARYQAVLNAGGSQQQAQQVADAGAGDEFEDPRDVQLRELQQWREQQEAQRTADEQAQLEAQEAADDEAYAETFENTLRQQLVAGGFAADAASAPQQMVAAVASVAGQIDQATEDDIPIDQLIGMAINQLKQLGMQPVGAPVPAVPGRQGIPPVGGGSGSRPVVGGGFTSKSDRDAAMIAAAQAALAQ